MKTYYKMKPGVLPKLLAENDITQTEFAELVDIPKAMMSFYGNGKLNVPEERIKKIAEQFGVRIEDIADAVERRRERAPRASALVLLPGLRRCRLNAGLSQKELAAKAGLCRGSIVAWEANNRRAEVIKAHRLCEALGVQLNDLTRADAETLTGEPVTANMSLNELASALVNAVATVRSENERLKTAVEKWGDEVATVRSENERLKATQKKWEDAFTVLGLAPIK